MSINLHSNTKTLLIRLIYGQTFGEAVEIPLGMSAFHIGVLGLKSRLQFRFQLPAANTFSEERKRSLSAMWAMWTGFEAYAFNWSVIVSPGHCWRLGNETANGRSLSLDLSLSYFSPCTLSLSPLYK